MHYHPLFLYRHQVLKQADTVLAHFLYEEGRRGAHPEQLSTKAITPMIPPSPPASTP